MNFNFLEPPYEIPKTMMVELKNLAKTKFPYLEGIYELSPQLHKQLPEWKMLGGEPYSIKSFGSNKWYIWRSDGSISTIYTKDQGQAHELLPSDTSNKWHVYNGSAWVEAASGDVKVGGK